MAAINERLPEELLFSEFNYRDEIFGNNGEACGV
jgi:hypothetical protein